MSGQRHWVTRERDRLTTQHTGVIILRQFLQSIFNIGYLAFSDVKNKIKYSLINLKGQTSNRTNCPAKHLSGKSIEIPGRGTSEELRRIQINSPGIIGPTENHKMDLKFLSERSGA